MLPGPRSSLLQICLAAVFPILTHGITRPSRGFAEHALPFLEENCLDCHEPGLLKGGLDLTNVDPTMAAPGQAELWTRIHDRISRGEMPPEKKPRPGRAEIDRLLGWLRPRLLDADRAQREVVQRRLNRAEYENTIHDLLAIDIPLKNLLPEDQQAHGFDNIGAALAISPEQMQGYLDAARAAVNAALVKGPQPKTETFTVDSLKEVQRHIDLKEYGFVDGRVVTYLSGDSNYSKIATRERKTTDRGRYRVRFEAAAVGTEESLVFAVTTSDYAHRSDNFRNLGYFEVSPKPQVFEFECVIEEKDAFQFFPLGLPTYIKKPAEGNHRGIGFGAVTVTGPIHEQWPPKSHTGLVGDLDLAIGTAEDAERILRAFLPRAFRRPIVDADVDRFATLVRAQLADGRTFEESLKTGLVAVLCSPNFLYLREEARPDSRQISQTELASRLSYFLWNSMPDAELLGLAEGGRLQEPAVLHAQVERLLKNPKAEAFVKNFTGQWLRLRQINETVPDEKLYRGFDELLQVSMVWEGEGFFRQLLAEDLSIVNVLDSDFAMLNQRLAEHYQVPGVKGLALRKVQLPADSVRGGVLTQGAVLKVTANGTNTSPVLRGVWVLENILGEGTPPSPPNTGGIEPDIRGAVTIREQLEKHREDESCHVCHRTIDPPGFALESFDPTGRYRENYLRFVVSNPEHGWGSVQKAAKVDASGKMSTGEPFTDIREFKRLLLSRQDVFAHCLTEKLMTYALGRPIGFSDRAAMTQILGEVKAKGYGLRTLVHAIVQSETFATR